MTSAVWDVPILPTFLEQTVPDDMLSEEVIGRPFIPAESLEDSTESLEQMDCKQFLDFSAYLDSNGEMMMEGTYLQEESSSDSCGSQPSSPASSVDFGTAYLSPLSPVSPSAMSPSDAPDITSKSSRSSKSVILPTQLPVPVEESDLVNLDLDDFQKKVGLRLTKNEEKELKRLRRKAKNKLSAATSRQKKREYVGQLEERVEKTKEENFALRRRVTELEKENLQLRQELAAAKAADKPRTSIGSKGAKLCLMMVVLSFGLMMNQKPEEGLALPSTGVQTIGSPIGRRLLSHDPFISPAIQTLMDPDVASHSSKDLHFEPGTSMPVIDGLVQNLTTASSYVLDVLAETMTSTSILSADSDSGFSSHPSHPRVIELS